MSLNAGKITLGVRMNLWKKVMMAAPPFLSKPIRYRLHPHLFHGSVIRFDRDFGHTFFTFEILRKWGVLKDYGFHLVSNARDATCCNSAPILTGNRSPVCFSFFFHTQLCLTVVEKSDCYIINLKGDRRDEGCVSFDDGI